MNRLLATTALALMLGAAPALAQSPEAPVQPEPPSAIPSELSTKALDQSSEGATVITPDKSAENTGSTQGTAQFLNEQKSDDLLASTLIGQSVYNSQDENIGEVNDLVTDRSGKIIAALIGVGGFLGIGEKDVAVRFEDLKLARAGNNVVVGLNLNKETLASTPDYKTLDEQAVVEGSAKSEDKTKTN